MKKSIALFTYILFAICSYAQERALKLIENKKYDKAFEYITKNIKDAPNDIVLNFAKSKLYSSPDFTGVNTDSAYVYIKKSENIYSNLDPKLKQKTIDIITDNVIQSTKKQICIYAFNNADKSNTVEAYDKFIAYYLDADTLLATALKHRDKKAYEQSVEVNSIDSYQGFIDKYPHAIQVNEAVGKRNELAFMKAVKSNTLEGYNEFITKYPDAKEIPDAVKIHNKLAFNNAVTINTITSYEDFLNECPDAEEKEEATNKRDVLAYHLADSLNTTKAYSDFIQKYPNSQFYNRVDKKYEIMLFGDKTISGNITSYIYFIEQYENLKQAIQLAQDSLFYYSYLNQDLSGMQYYMDKCPSCSKADNSYQKYFEVYTSDGDNSSIEDFENKYPDKVSSESIYKANEIANEGQELFLAYFQSVIQKKDISFLNKRFDLFIKKSAPKHIAWVALQTILKPDIMTKNYMTALKKLKYYEEYFDKNDRNITGLKDILSAEIDPSIQIKSIGTNINSKGDECQPILSADNKMLYFCGEKRSDNIGGEDIFSCPFNGNSRPKLLPDINTSNGNEAPLSISTDGTQLLMFRNGNIYKTNKTSYGWSDIEPIDTSSSEEQDNEANNSDENESEVKTSTKINTENWQADAMITSDGKALIFVSDRPGGIGFYHHYGKYYCGSIEGNVDIYVCLKNKDGSWGNPINLGSTINTPYCDRSPFLHPDMKTLYFSSNGHGGLGGLDVYKSTRLYDTSWVYWSTPINMGKEINTVDDDWGYNISTDGEKALFAKEINGEEKIFYLNLPPHLRPNYVATISGKLVDKNNKPISAKIKWEDLETSKDVGESKSDPVDGSFFIVLPLGKIYGYYIDNKEFFPISNSIDLRNEKKAIEVQKNIDLVTFKDMVDEGIAVPINNLFFLTNKYELLPSSIPELKRVANIIKSKNLKIEISGYCDSTGTKELNQKLSEQRAGSVKDFLVQQGCQSDMFTVIGYGDTKPIGSNETEEGRAQNRRVELKFIK